MPASARRRLIWIPIIHSQEDLGGLSASVRRLQTHHVGRRKWQEYQAAVDDMWSAIRAEIDRLNFDYHALRVYQDGLACCGREEEIVRDLARSGSRNYQIVQELTDRGARLMGTESSKVLIEEYQLARRALRTAGAGRAATPAQREASDRTLERRDCFIAERINETLRPGETGLIFLGLLHSLTGRLAADIEVTRFSVAAPINPAAAQAS